MVLCDHDLNIDAKQKLEMSTAGSEICAVTQNQFSYSPNQLHQLCAMTQNQFSYSSSQLHNLCAMTQNQFSCSPNQLHQLCRNTKPIFIFSQPAVSSVCHDKTNFPILPTSCINCAITQNHFSYSPNHLHHLCAMTEPIFLFSQPAASTVP